MVTKREPRAKRIKWDESDFEFVLEDRSNADKERAYKVIGNRVMDNPIRHKVISVGRYKQSTEICFHGKAMAATCPTCEFEAPRINP